MDTTTHLSFISRSLHWIIAIAFIAMSGIGIYMSEFEVWPLYSLHKSGGVILFILIVLRVIWRAKQGWPTPVSKYQKIEHVLSKFIHWLLLLGTVAMPITGMLFSGLSGHGFGVFGWTLVNANYAPGNMEQVIPHSEMLTAISAFAHQSVGYILAGAIMLHIAGALKHHLIDKDRTLLRMLGK